MTPNADQPANLSRLIAEFTAGRSAATDAFLGAPQLIYAARPDQADALEAVDWAALAPWAEGLATSDGVGLSVLDQYTTFTCNTNEFAEDELPKTADDLLRLKQPLHARSTICSIPPAPQSTCTSRHQRIRFVLSHCGGFGPYAAHRIACTTPIADVGVQPERFLAELRRFHFDTARSASEPTLDGLLAFSDGDHLLYGSDWSFAPNRCDRHFTAEVDAYPFDARQRAAIARANALRLFRLDRAA